MVKNLTGLGSVSRFDHVQENKHRYIKVYDNGNNIKGLNTKLKLNLYVKH